MRASIPFEEVTAFVEGLGVDIVNVASVEITHSCVSVTEFRLNEAGRRFLAGDQMAKTVTDIRIERGTA
ncbi:hypothetical protein [Streptomyces sp. SHP 1-2]|uniref:hypothetical protein n=1 Tax=Streptomyces sp. SHP 1-2 TaxID=2769489 RepID=UPI002238F99C|nr:hypothetical protein [Streptomyces sp. SHP 1-2]MCW5252215.1 hypothetical protein [Streptomyces sp. SHP 1-2]